MNTGVEPEKLNNRRILPDSGPLAMPVSAKIYNVAMRLLDVLEHNKKGKSTQNPEVQLSTCKGRRLC